MISLQCLRLSFDPCKKVPLYHYNGLHCAQIHDSGTLIATLMLNRSGSIAICSYLIRGQSGFAPEIPGSGCSHLSLHQAIQSDEWTVLAGYLVTRLFFFLPQYEDMKWRQHSPISCTSSPLPVSEQTDVALLPGPSNPRCHTAIPIVFNLTLILSSYTCIARDMCWYSKCIRPFWRQRSVLGICLAEVSYVGMARARFPDIDLGPSLFQNAPYVIALAL